MEDTISALIGIVLERYHLLETLGEGGMAVVYKAYDIRLETEVAVKVIRTENLPPSTLDRALKRFEREAKALAKLTHPNIVKVTDYGEIEGRPYLVMPYLPGGTLKQKLKGKPVPWQEAARLLVPVARALDYAHRQNMIHRDVKPSNILITEDGEPMLTDFGIAKIIDEEATVDLTSTSATVGTPEYMAPEQVISKAVDHRADIYALGVVFYEMITGRKPFQADTPMGVLVKHASEPLPRPGQYVRDLPESVESVLLKMLAKRPDDRYASMAEVAKVLDDIAIDGRLSVVIEKPESLSAEVPPLSAPVVLVDDQATVDQLDEPLELENPATVLQSEPVVSKVELSNPATVLQPETVNNPNKKIIYLGDGVAMTLVHVPAGKFIMGNRKGEGFQDEYPQHEVYLGEYWVGKTPVTNKQYYQFLLTRKRKLSEYWNDRDALFGRENHPIVFVTWHDAIEFCAWASEISGERVRLPSEAEWEKAARGIDGRKYPWGERAPIKSLCNYGKNLQEGHPSAVGQFSPQGDGPFGCADLAGNVWEWVNDWYSETYYADLTDENNPSGPTTGKFRVLRGGSWYDNEYNIRCAMRNRYVPDYVYNTIGFRCACS